MAQLIVRNLNDAIKERLRRRAVRRGRSMEEEVREILRAAAGQDEAEGRKARLGSRIARRFAGLGLADELPELHGLAVPAELSRE
ncbi:MAG: FitA-like ribbon-helix-helix domain-containing protein [Acetobacteraceae bacterium]